MFFLYTSQLNGLYDQFFILQWYGNAKEHSIIIQYSFCDQLKLWWTFPNNDYWVLSRSIWSSNYYCFVFDDFLLLIWIFFACETAILTHDEAPGILFFFSNTPGMDLNIQKLWIIFFQFWVFLFAENKLNTYFASDLKTLNSV